MKNLLRIEQLALFLLSIYLFSLTQYKWWLFPALILVPDLSMIGYLINTRIGAFLYNLGHHQGIAVAILIAGMHFSIDYLALSGIILLGHSAMDRIFGYGLKFSDSFKHTHLGTL